MKLHVLSLPHTEPTDAYSWCAYSNKVRRFVQMMTSLGHEAIPYYGKGMNGTVPKWDANDPVWFDFNQKCVNELYANSKPGEFLCITGGNVQKPVADLFRQLIPVEYGVGYSGVFAPYRVYESHAWRHAVMAEAAGGAYAADGRASDIVIPNSYNDDEFTLGAGDGGYLLYMGRFIERKGVRIAVEVANRMKMPLVVAGSGDMNILSDCRNLHYNGVVGPIQRNVLMGEALAALVPTQYLGPFEGVAVESQLAGTPAITSDFGAFTETVIHGVTGFRCRTIDEYCEAVEKASTLDRSAIRASALARYSTTVVRHQYERYFQSIAMPEARMEYQNLVDKLKGV